MVWSDPSSKRNANYLLIGAIDLQLGFELATRNAHHFEMIPHLVVKQP